MSKLRDCAGKLTQLIVAAEAADSAYQQAATLLRELDAGQEVDLSGLGMKIVFDGGAEIPVPLTGDRQVLSDAVAQSASFLGNEVVRLWQAIYDVAAEANQHCHAAAERARAQQQQQALTPAAPQHFTSNEMLPPPQPPVPRPIGQAPTVPKLSPVHTTDVSHEKR